LECVEYPVLTAEAAVRLATSNYSLIDLLQAEEGFNDPNLRAAVGRTPRHFEWKPPQRPPAPWSREGTYAGGCGIRHFSTIRFPVYRTPYKGCQAMKPKLPGTAFLPKVRYRIHFRDCVDHFDAMLTLLLLKRRR
jgi:hypothetical protein